MDILTDLPIFGQPEEVEEWRPIPGMPGCKASNLGRVQVGKGKPKFGNPTNKCYLGMTARVDGKTKYISVHRAVLMAFVGPCPEGHECMHLDENKTNNRLSNLRWGSMAENWAQRNAGSNAHTWNRKLTIEQVREIRRKWDGVTVGVKSLAREYGVGKNTMADIIRGNTYRDVT